jgi:hypothetical protein
MLHDQLSALHDALQFGPGNCPADLFDGSVPMIVRGLRVHANNVAHARHVAMEETYPRLLMRMGASEFHAAVDRFLESGETLSQPLDALGEGFAPGLQDPADRDLASIEWAWLQSFHAAEAETLTVSQLTVMTPDEVVQLPIALHPAVRIVALADKEGLNWDEPIDGSGGMLMITRPHAEVLLRRITEPAAQIISLVERGPLCGEVLGDDPASLLALIEAGAITTRGK